MASKSTLRSSLRQKQQTREHGDLQAPSAAAASASSPIPSPTETDAPLRFGAGGLASAPAASLQSAATAGAGNASVVSPSRHRGGQSSRPEHTQRGSGQPQSHSPMSTPTHTPATTAGTDVRQMERDLLQLLDDFHAGKLLAFGVQLSIRLHCWRRVREAHPGSLILI